MESANELFEKIEEYLNGNLDGSSVAEFEKQIEENSIIKNQVQNHKIAKELILRNRLAQVEAFSKLEGQKYASSKNKYLGLVGAFILVASIAVLWQFRNFITVDKTKINSQESSDTSIFYITQSQPNSGSEIQKTIENKAIIQPKSIELNDTVRVEEKREIELKNNTKLDSPKNEAVSALEPNKSKFDTVLHKIHLKNDPCKDVNLKATIETTPSCDGEVNGSLVVNQIKGGQKPYTIKVVSDKTNTEVLSTHLESGIYRVLLKDFNGCFKEFEDVKIASISCPQEVIFNPLLGETWAVQPHEFNATLTIFDNKGVVVLNEQIEANSTFIWDGKQANGEVNSGFFVYLFKYANGVQQQGNITILK